MVTTTVASSSHGASWGFTTFQPAAEFGNRSTSSKCATAFTDAPLASIMWPSASPITAYTAGRPNPSRRSQATVRPATSSTKRRRCGQILANAMPQSTNTKGITWYTKRGPFEAAKESARKAVAKTQAQNTVGCGR